MATLPPVELLPPYCLMCFLTSVHWKIPTSGLVSHSGLLLAMTGYTSILTRSNPEVTLTTNTAYLLLQGMIPTCPPPGITYVALYSTTAIGAVSAGTVADRPQG